MTSQLEIKIDALIAGSKLQQRLLDEATARIAETERVLGPKMKCCGRYAVEHGEWVGKDAGELGSLFCPADLDGEVYATEVTPEYEAWRKERGR